MLIRIRQITPLRPDDRGPALGFEIHSSEYLVVLRRKKGTVSGLHYHKGLCCSKNPEVFYLVSGTARIVVQDIQSGTSEEHTLGEDTLIEIPAWVYHEVHALTDIVLLELNRFKEDFRKDTFYPENTTKNRE